MLLIIALEERSIVRLGGQGERRHGVGEEFNGDDVNLTLLGALY